MTPKRDIACILAGGVSARFGPSNKLLELIDGDPIIHHVISSVKAAGYQHIAAIVSNDSELRSAMGHDIHLIDNRHPSLGQSFSLSLAARYALKVHAQSLLIVLGDMPFVTPQHIKRLKASLEGYDAVISSNGEVLSPPLLVTPSVLPEFKRLSGDEGAKRLLGGLRLSTVITDASELRDIDYPKDLISRGLP